MTHAIRTLILTFCLVVLPAATVFSSLLLFPLAGLSQTPSFTFHTAHVKNNDAIALHGDLNGDGYEDLITIFQSQWQHGNAANFSSVLSNGDGSYKAPVTYTFPSGGGIPAVLADFNGDGKLDMAAFVLNQNSYYLYFGNGDGTFRARVTHTVSGLMVALGAADVNHDNKTDLLLLTTSDDGNTTDLQVLFANGDGTFRTGPTTHGLPGESGEAAFFEPVKLMTGDFDGDGNADVALWVGGTSVPSDYQVEVLSGDGDGNFSVTFDDYIQSTGLLEAADVNGDGITDLISTDTQYCNFPGCQEEQGQLIVFYGATNRQMEAADIFGDPSAQGGDQIAVADFNGDGIPDIAFTVDETTGAQLNGTNIAILSGIGNNQFGPPTLVSSTPYGFETGPFALRGNRDTKADLVYTDLGSSSVPNSVKTLLNTTVGDFPTCTAPNAVRGITLCSPAAGSAVSSPVNFAIGAAGTIPMQKVEVWADGKKQVQQLGGAFSNYSFLNASVPLAAGSHKIVLFAAGWDNSLQSKTFTLDVKASSCSAPSSDGVHICSPVSGSTVDSPVLVEATAKVTGTIVSTQLWVDGVKNFNAPGSTTLTTSVSLDAGTHRFAVIATNTSGQKWESTVNATVK